MKIQINSVEALERLIGGDTEEIEQRLKSKIESIESTLRLRLLSRLMDEKPLTAVQKSL